VEQFSRGLRVEIYCGEADQVNHRPRYQAILEVLRKEGAAGTTVTRGIAGFGRASLIHTAAVLRLSMDLPVVITWIDAPERVERLLPRVRELAGSGVITVEEIGVASYGERAIGKMRFDLQVRDVMTSRVESVPAGATVRRAVDALLGKPFRALPVVDDGRLVGVVSNGDLVARGGLGARIELLNVISADERERFLARLPDRPISEVMTRGPVTVAPTATLTDATRLIGERRLKRLPVVEAGGVLVGIISRADVLRAVAEAFPNREPETADRGDAHHSRGGARVARDVMRLDVPVVAANAGLPAVVDAVCSTRLNRAVVVDADRRVLGVVSDAVVLQALGSAGGNLVGALMGRAGVGEAPKRTARELMVTPGLTVPPDAPLSQVARIMTEHRRKIVPVADAQGRLLGIIDRADLLLATHAALTELTATATADDED
jgi:CBS domain-containing protein